MTLKKPLVIIKRMIINGQEYALPQKTLKDILTALEVVVEHVAVEFDGAIVPQTEYATTQIPVDARLEIIHFVGGG